MCIKTKQKKFGKKFLIIAPFTAISREEIFGLFKENKIWIGYGFANGNDFFRESGTFMYQKNTIYKLLNIVCFPCFFKAISLQNIEPL